MDGMLSVTRHHPITRRAWHLDSVILDAIIYDITITQSIPTTHSHHPIIPSSHHPSIPSSHHPIIPSFCHPINQLSHNPIILSSYHPIIMIIITTVVMASIGLATDPARLQREASFRTRPLSVTRLGSPTYSRVPSSALLHSRSTISSKRTSGSGCKRQILVKVAAAFNLGLLGVPVISCNMM